jgi:hypothetical protein
MTNYDLDYCLRRRAEYEAASDEPGFDRQRFRDMISGCAYRRELLRQDLTAKVRAALQEVVNNERADLWAEPTQELS